MGSSAARCVHAPKNGFLKRNPQQLFGKLCK
jgi:hypothetical protein